MLNKQIRVNIRAAINASDIRKEKRNGRDVIIVPSATLPDDVIMNGIKYPADEIKKSFHSLNRTPAPLGHPLINGKFVSARDPEGINIGWIGAWNENVRQEDGRVLLDKVIDVEVANSTVRGKAVLNAIEKGEPIHTSTGLLCLREPATNGATDHKYVARNMVFDHDAILLDEAGAATPDQGVGMLVNADGQDEEIEVINSSLTDAADQDLNWAVESLARAMERRQKVSVLERMKAAILDALGIPERAPSTNHKEDEEMAVSDEQFAALSAEVKTLSEGMAKIGTTVAEAVGNAVKPLVEAQQTALANQKAKDDAEHTELVNAVVKANLLTEDVAKETPLATLRALAPKATPGTAAALNGAVGNGVEKPKFGLPKAEGK